MTHHPVPPFGNRELMFDPCGSWVAGHFYPAGELTAILRRCKIYLDGKEVRNVLAYNIAAGYVVQGVDDIEIDPDTLQTIYGRRTLWGKVAVIDPLAVDLAEVYLK